MEQKMQDEIAKVAYDLYEKGGRVPGREMQDWLEAERIVRARAEKNSAGTGASKPPKAAAKGKK